MTSAVQDDSCTRLLLVEDNDIDAKLVMALLSRSKSPRFEVLRGTTLAEGLDIVQHEEPQVVLLDLILPDGEGLDTFRSMHQVAQNLPILVLTSLDDNEIGLQAVREGAQDYLHKQEIRLEVLVRAIRYAIERETISRKLADTVQRLENALEQVTTLKGLLPICMHCKNIRNDNGYWTKVELFLRDHSDVRFSHGLCPDCMDKFYPDV